MLQSLSEGKTAEELNKPDGHMIPEAVLAKAVPLRVPQAAIDSLGAAATSAEELAQAFDVWSSWQPALEGVLAACASSCNGIESTRKQRQKQAEASQRKAAGKAKEKAKSKARPSATEPQASAQTSTHQIFEMNLDGHRDIEVLKNTEGLLEPNLPHIIRGHAVVTNLATTNPCRFNATIFMGGLGRSALLKDARVINGKVQQHASLLELLKQEGNPWLLTDSTVLAGNLLCGGKRGLEQIGMQMNGVGSIRAFLLDGSQVVIVAAPLVAVQKHIRTAKKMTKPPSLDNIGLVMFLSATDRIYMRSPNLPFFVFFRALVFISVFALF